MSQATPYPCRLDGRPVHAVVGPDGLDVDGRLVSWLDADDLVEGDHALTLVLPGDERLTLTHLAAAHDRFCAEVREARGTVRRAALAEATGAPIDSYLARGDGRLVDVHLYPNALVVEPRPGPPTVVPLPSVTEVGRDGWTVTVSQRVFDPVVVQGVGARTDELVADLARARHDLAEATAQAWAGFAEPLAGLVTPDGWALSAGEAGRWWGALRAAVLGASRAAEASLLAGLAGDELRLGMWTDGGRQAMPFLLAPVRGRVAIEATDADDRATFVFATDDVERLNAVLVLTAFRREALSLPEAELGRWAPAVRTVPAVRWAREALVGRVVHDEGWAAGIQRLLGGLSPS